MKGYILGLRQVTCGELAGTSRGMMTGIPKDTSGAKETEEHPGDNMGALINFGGLEMESNATFAFQK